MSIHNQQVADVGTGFEKEIDQESLPMVYDNLQISQYMYPKKSTVREISSNGWDSVQEKLIALKILKGEAKVEDYFVESSAPGTKDSKWNPTYYDPQWLDEHNNQVQIRYVEGGPLGDTIEFIDPGVGLGGNRLEGYFKLAWSSKRTFKAVLGKFGIGAKSPLSTGIDMFTMETAYNGQKYRFNIYSHKYDSIIPSFNMETGEPNDFVIFRADDPDPERRKKVHFQRTTDKNYVKVSFKVKTHHKPEYIQAVMSQLLYFSNIKMILVDQQKNETVIDPYAPVLYEDEHLIISSNHQYSKPHLVVNGVSYGYVDWAELELQDRGGNVGIKVNMDDISVNPSRESVIWNERTRQTVLSKIDMAMQSATRILQEQLQFKSLGEWLKAVMSVVIKDDDSILGRLSRFTATNRFSITYELMGYKLTPGNILEILKRMSNSFELGQLEKQSKKRVYKSQKEFRLEDLFSYPLYTTLEEVKTYRKRKYVCMVEEKPVLFINVRPQSKEWRTELRLYGNFLEEKEQEGKDLRLEIPIEDAYKLFDTILDQFVEPNHDLDDIEVPPGFTLSESDEDEEEEVKPERIKKQVKNANVTVWGAGESVNYEAEVNKLHKLDYPEVFMGTYSDEDTERAKFISHISVGNYHGALRNPNTGERLDRSIYTDAATDFSQMITNKTHGFVLYGDDSAGMYGHITGAVVLQMATDYYKKHIQRYYTFPEFFVRVSGDGKTIGMSNTLKNWYTARLINSTVRKYRALYHMNGILPEHSAIYRRLYDFWLKYHVDFTSVTNDNTIAEVVSWCDKVASLQRVMDNDSVNNDDVAKLSKELFSTEYENAEAYDRELIDSMKMLDELESVMPLLERLDIAFPNALLEDLECEEPVAFTHDQEQVIKEFLTFKKVI